MPSLSFALRNDVESSSSNAAFARARSIARKAATMVISIRYTGKIIEPGMPSLTVLPLRHHPAHRVGIVPACNLTSIREKPSVASAHARLTAVYGYVQSMIALALHSAMIRKGFEGYQ